MPLIPGFSQGGVNNRIDNWVVSIEQRIIWALSQTGESFANDAKEFGSYTDHTGNLRSSVGYIIARDGNILTGKFEGTPEGKIQGQKIADEVLRENTKGFILICVAGMGYAAAVESKGKDVITGSIPAAKALLKAKVKEYRI